jgi:probable rRNA maturation factor
VILTTSLLTMTTFPDFPSPADFDKLSVSNTSGLGIPVGEEAFLNLLQIVEKEESVTFRAVELVFVDEKEIVRVNKEYLDHDYVTDIITFRYNENVSDSIEGTLFCCAQRIEEQSKEYNSDKPAEYLRVFVHGLIHLAGHDDQIEEEKKRMTELENRYLELLNNSL